MIVIRILWTILLSFCAGFASAQTHNFNQTGKIRPIISESETKIPSRKDTMHDAGLKFPTPTESNAEFYFTYSVIEDGVLFEKWFALPNDRALSQFSNQSVRVSGSLKNNKLLNFTVSPLTTMSEEYLTSPPPTTGLYKVVAVPLTIQPLSSQGKPGTETAPLEVTPEAIRNNLFNAPDAVNKFYLEASYGMLRFTGVQHPQVDVVPVTIQSTISANCQDQIINQFTPIVRQRLLEQNIDTTNGSVDLGIIIFNDTPGCPPYPFAARGALGQRGVPNWVWMPESWFATGPAIMAHEIGHALGGNHPIALRCKDFDNPQTCVIDEDPADRDMMTSAGRYYLLPNNYERRRWGWHPPGVFDNASSGFVPLFDLHSPITPFVKEGTRQGRFYFRNLTGVHLGWDIYPETRRNWGQFERYQGINDSYRLGIAVRIGHSNYGAPEARSVLIDPNNTAELEDAPLRENQQVLIGGVFIKCTREHNPGWGTRMRVQE